MQTKVVAPYVGAWIETYNFVEVDPKLTVAPYVGAWIETKSSLNICYHVSSHPMWVRGLKPTC